MACSPGCGSKDHEAGRTWQSGVGAGENLSGRWLFLPPNPRQEPVTYPPSSLSTFSPSLSWALLPSSVSYPWPLASRGWRDIQGLRCTPLGQPLLHPKMGHGWQVGKSDMTDCGRGVAAQGHGLAISTRYTVMSGTPEKILELLLEAMRPDSSAHDPTGRGRRHLPAL